ncbi:MAG: beta-glucosidase H [Capsulimonadaceae bacterium]
MRVVRYLAVAAVLFGTPGWLWAYGGPVPMRAHRLSADTAPPLYLRPGAPVEARVSDLLGRMTQDEKLGMLTGTGFTTQAIPRLSVPRMGMADAGQGVRGGTDGTKGPATTFPTEVDMGATWNTVLLGQIGAAIGTEARNKGEGARIMLGPDINIHRSPLGGRDAESFTEDPYLMARLTTAYVLGMQSTGTSACLKHYLCNNEEQDRNTVDVRVDQRALHEIYLPAFKAGVENAHVWSVMAAYNMVNGAYCTANHPLETDILKGEFGFDGIIMSDWSAVHDTVGAINGGCDLEMPGGQFMTHDHVRDALASGAITQQEIDDSVRRILRTIIRVGLLDGPFTPNHSQVNSPEHQALAYRAATEGIVLLKNDNAVLPLDRTAIHSIAVIGPAAAHMQAGAYGSPYVDAPFTIQPLDAITKLVGSTVKVNFAQGIHLPDQESPAIPSDALSPPGAAAGQHGLRGEYFVSPDLSGTPAATVVDPQLQYGPQFHEPASVKGRVNSVRWTGTVTAPITGHYKLVVESDSGVRLVVAGKTLINEPNHTEWWHGADVDMTAGQTYDLEVDLLNIEFKISHGTVHERMGWITPEVDAIEAAAAAAAKSDVAVVFATTGGLDGEGRDRPGTTLPGNQDELIRAVAAANKNTIVVLNAGSPCDVTGWIDSVPALIDAGYPGMEGGRALADILFGVVNPSGKLTDTFAYHREDYPDYGDFPGGGDGMVHYAEGIYVGYRYFDKQDVKPLFPFGYGLSYTTFDYTGMNVSSDTLKPDGNITVTADITNSGKRAGKEVVELYIQPLNPTIERPVRELKGFVKLEIGPGQTKQAVFTINPQDLAYFDVKGNRWEADPGAYDIEIGASSRNRYLRKEVRLESVYTMRP